MKSNTELFMAPPYALYHLTDLAVIISDFFRSTNWMNNHTENKLRLLDQARDKLRLKHYSYRTEQSYIAWMKRFIFFHNKLHPAAMGEKEIEAFLTHLAVKRNVSASTQNQALCALLFLYKEVLGRATHMAGFHAACQASGALAGGVNCTGSAKTAE